MQDVKLDRREFLQSATLVATAAGAAAAAAGTLAADASPAAQPSAAHGGEIMTRRWTEQRWLLDNPIRAVGVDWDQPRSVSYNAPCGPEANADFAAIRSRVQNYADIAPAFEATAKRRAAKAKKAAKDEQPVSARQNYFMAAIHYAAAQWVYDDNNAKNIALNERKRNCYSNYAKLADHKVEAAWVPFQGKALPGWLHLPPGYQGGRIPAGWAIPGMDGFKEGSVSMYGDRFLSRGIAVLALEGPGQSESAVLGIHVSVPNWMAAGRAVYEWLAERMMKLLQTNKQFVIYQDSRHSVGNVPAANLGPTPAQLAADWMQARFAGKSFASERWFVEARGRVAMTAYLIRMRRGIAILAGALLTMPLATAHAQAYPNKVVRIVVPTSAGGGGDLIARLIAKALGERWGRQVVVDNRTGAGTMLGSELVVRAAPDGYTLLMTPSTLAINPAAYKKVPYDALRDFAPITQAAVVPNLMMVHPSVPAKNVREMIALAKSKPGQLFYASSGHGTSPHLSMELFSLMAGIKMIQVPYKSSGPGVIDLLAGQVALMAPSMISGIPHVRSGKLRALGVTTTQRAPSAPDIPTIAESGLPGYESAQWYGLLAPAGTPREVLEKLHREVTSVLLAPEHRELLGSEGGIVVAGSPEAFAGLIRTETAKWLDVAKAAGLTPE